MERYNGYMGRRFANTNVSGYTFKTIAILIFLTFSSYNSFGQKYSVTIDSLTKAYINELPRLKKRKFKKILKQRRSMDLFKRIDTTTFDYAFIEERFCYYYDNLFGDVKERYFIGHDSIPKYFYTKGTLSNLNQIYYKANTWYLKNISYHETFLPLFNTYSRSKPTQELSYNKIQLMYTFCFPPKNAKEYFERRRTKELKKTYQIRTMIDRVNHRMIVSIQLPPKRPQFEIRRYNRSFDF